MLRAGHHIVQQLLASDQWTKVITVGGSIHLQGICNRWTAPIQQTLETSPLHAAVVAASRLQQWVATQLHTAAASRLAGQYAGSQAHVGGCARSHTTRLAGLMLLGTVCVMQLSCRQKWAIPGVVQWSHGGPEDTLSSPLREHPCTR